MDDSPQATDSGPKAPTSRRPRRWLVPAVGATAVGIVAGAALAGSAVGWFEGDAEASGGIAHPLPSTARALTAAILEHVPPGVTVVWSSGSGGLLAAEPGIGPAPMLNGSLTSEVLMRVGDDEFLLSLVSSPAEGMGGGSDLGALGDGVITRDKQGRPVSEMIGSGSTVIVESANPGPAVPLPLSDDDLKALLADPLVGQQTDAAMLARSRSLPSYTTTPPPLTWNA